MADEEIDEDEVTWFAYHDQDEAGSYRAGVIFTGIKDHDEAVHLMEMIERIMKKALEDTEVPHVSQIN